MTEQSIEIPAQSGRWVRLRAGAHLRIIDIEGAQVADLFAVNADDPGEWLSVVNTRDEHKRLFPAVGQAFCSTTYRPMLTFVADDSPGFHDAQFSACNPLTYQDLGFEGYHPSCAENFRTAAAACGWIPELVPDPINIFQRTPVIADGRLVVEPAASGPGDSVTLRAEMDLFVIVTACSMDLEPINGSRCTPIGLEIRSA